MFLARPRKFGLSQEYDQRRRCAVLLLMFIAARVIKAVDWWDRRRLRAGKPPVGILTSVRAGHG
jgi:hypothetical protein